MQTVPWIPISVVVMMTPGAAAITANRKIDWRIKRLKLLVGYPFSPKIVKKANCGPTVLATLLGVETDEAMQVMDQVYKKGWNGYTNVGHIRAVLKFHGIAMIKTKEFDDMKSLDSETFPQINVLLFLQIEGPWLESKYWRDAYTHTHWCLAYAARMMDVNNSRIMEDDPVFFTERPQWEKIEEWQDSVMPRVIASFENATGWHVRAGYYIEEMKK